MTSTGNAKKRIFYYDFLRCFAILSVIACHVFAIPVVRISNFGSGLWYYSLFLNTLRDIAVPMFVLISGALLLDKKETLAKFTKKRINRVIIPYLVWTIIFILFTYMCSQIGIGKPNLSLESIISSVATIRLVGIPTYFWFVQMIFVVYIVIFILNKLNERYPNTLKIALVLGLIIIAAYNLNIIPLERPSNYPFYDIFAVIGYYLSKIDLKIDENKLTIIFFVVSVVLYILEVLLIASSSLAANKYAGISQFELLNVVILCSTFLFARYFSKSRGLLGNTFDKIENSKLGDAINSISFTSFGIYLCHMMIFVLFQYILTPLQDQNYFIYVNLVLILTIGISWFIIWVLSKIPHVNKISGAG